MRRREAILSRHMSWAAAERAYTHAHWNTTVPQVQRSEAEQAAFEVVQKLLRIEKYTADTSKIASFRSNQWKWAEATEGVKEVVHIARFLHQLLVGFTATHKVWFNHRAAECS